MLWDGPLYTTVKCAYFFRLLTFNETLGPLIAKQRTVEFSKTRDSTGAPFIHLNELFSQENKYISNDSIIIELALSVVRQRQILTPKNQNELTMTANIKSEPQSPVRLHTRKLDVVHIPDSMAQMHAAKVTSSNDLQSYNSPRSPLSLPSSSSSPSPSSSSSSSKLFKRKHDETKPDLCCILCASNLLEKDTYNTKCGHLYCKDCIHEDIIPRKMCIKCNRYVKKNQCNQIYFTHDQRIRKNRSVDTRATKKLLTFVDNIDHNSNEKPYDFELTCPMCMQNLFDIETFTTMCGHLYCKQCLQIDIRQRKMCIVCNGIDNPYYWTQIYFS